MDHSFWADRWSARQLGFHEGAVNAHLSRHVARLGRGSVLVPLCGKAEDLAFLAAQGLRVFGVEWVEDAVKAFFAERRLSPAVTRQGPLVAYASGGLTLWAGDFFAVTGDLAPAGGFDAFYDRAALIALPPDTRPRYAAHLRSLLKPGAQGLLVTVDYEQAQMPGPPFAVSEAEVRRLWAPATLERLDDVAAAGPRFQTLAAREQSWAVAL